MLDSLKWLIFGGGKLGCLLISLVMTATIGFGLFATSMERANEREKAILKGKASREDGANINSNPYIEPEYRELWRQGWRSGQVVKE